MEVRIVYNLKNRFKESKKPGGRIINDFNIEGFPRFYFESYNKSPLDSFVSSASYDVVSTDYFTKLINEMVEAGYAPAEIKEKLDRAKEFVGLSNKYSDLKGMNDSSNEQELIKIEEELKRLYDDCKHDLIGRKILEYVYVSNRILYDDISKSYERGKLQKAQDFGRDVGNFIYGPFYKHELNTELLEKEAMKVMLNFNDTYSNFKRLSRSNINDKTLIKTLNSTANEMSKKRVDAFKDVNWRDDVSTIIHSSAQLAAKIADIARTSPSWLNKIVGDIKDDAVKANKIAKWNSLLKDPGTYEVFYRQGIDLVQALKSGVDVFTNWAKKTGREKAWQMAMDCIGEGFCNSIDLLSRHDFGGNISDGAFSSYNLIWMALTIIRMGDMAHDDWINRNKSFTVDQFKDIIKTEFNNVVTGQKNNLNVADEIVKLYASNACMDVAKKMNEIPITSREQLNKFKNEIKKLASQNGEAIRKDKDGKNIEAKVKNDVYRYVLSHIDYLEEDKTRINKALENGIMLEDLFAEYEKEIVTYAKSKRGVLGRLEKKVEKKTESLGSTLQFTRNDINELYGKSELNFSEYELNEIFNDVANRSSILDSFGIKIDLPTNNKNLKTIKLGMGQEDNVFNSFKRSLNETHKLDSIQERYVRLRLREAVYILEKKGLESEPPKTLKEVFSSINSNWNETTNDEKIGCYCIGALSGKNKTEAEKILYDEAKRVLPEDLNEEDKISRLAYVASSAKNLERDNHSVLNQQNGIKWFSQEKKYHQQMKRLLADTSKELNDMRRTMMNANYRKQLGGANKIHQHANPTWKKFEKYAILVIALACLLIFALGFIGLLAGGAIGAASSATLFTVGFGISAGLAAYTLGNAIFAGGQRIHNNVHGIKHTKRDVMKDQYEKDMKRREEYEKAKSLVKLENLKEDNEEDKKNNTAEVNNKKKIPMYGKVMKLKAINK